VRARAYLDERIEVFVGEVVAALDARQAGPVVVDHSVQDRLGAVAGEGRSSDRKERFGCIHAPARVDFWISA
jgi:hypothetical protein